MRSEQLGPLSGPWARVPKQRRRGQRAKKKLQNFESYHLSKSWKSNSTNLCTVYAHSMHMGSEYWHGLQHPSWVKRPITAFTELMVPTTTPTPLITFGSSQITQKHFFLQGQVLRNDPKHIKNAISFFFQFESYVQVQPQKRFPGCIRLRWSASAAWRSCLWRVAGAGTYHFSLTSGVQQEGNQAGLDRPYELGNQKLLTFYENERKLECKPGRGIQIHPMCPFTLIKHFDCLESKSSKAISKVDYFRKGLRMFMKKSKHSYDSLHGILVQSLPSIFKLAILTILPFDSKEPSVLLWWVLGELRRGLDCTSCLLILC